MADVGMQDRLQSLFEKLSDHYAEGLVELRSISPEHAEVEFLWRGGRTVGKARLSFVHATIDNLDLGEDLVRCVDVESGEECYVSALPSAIIAVVCR